ncbi:methionine permease [Metarhizium acridum]|nr:methionine permease [Metarhizium acridum]
MERLVGGARIEGKDTVKVNPSDASSGPDTENGQLEIARENKRQIGIPSAALLIFNRIIGTGIFATPATILAQCGSRASRS